MVRYGFVFLREEKDVIFGEFIYYWLLIVSEVVVILVEYGDEVCLFFGGYSLILMMKLCMVVFEYFVDLVGVVFLKGIVEDGGFIVIGVMII